MAPRVAIITGGSRGIGLGIARHLAASGLHIAINGVRDAADAADALEQIRTAAADGATALYARADVSDPDGRTRLVDEVMAHFGRIDVLINNAGVAPAQRLDMLDATEQSFDRVLGINLKGPYFLTQLVARRMIDHPDPAARRVIINVSSISATVASPSRGDYCISKAGIAMATRLWAAALAPHAIAVYEVRPGIIATDMTAGVTSKYDALLAGGLAIEPRWGTPDDVGRAVTLLASGQLTYATGNVLHVDGGLTIQRL